MKRVLGFKNSRAMLVTRRQDADYSDYSHGRDNPINPNSVARTDGEGDLGTQDHRTGQLGPRVSEAKPVSGPGSEGHPESPGQTRAVRLRIRRDSLKNTDGNVSPGFKLNSNHYHNTLDL